MKVLRTRDMVFELWNLVDKHGSQEAAAKALKVSPQFVSDVLSYRRGVTLRLAHAMGYERFYAYRKKAR